MEHTCLKPPIRGAEPGWTLSPGSSLDRSGLGKAQGCSAEAQPAMVPNDSDVLGAAEKQERGMAAPGSGLQRHSFRGSTIPTIISLDPQSNALTKRSRNYYANTQARNRGPGGDNWSVRVSQRAELEPELRSTLRGLRTRV